MVLEVELPGRGQRLGTHPAAAERCCDSNPAVYGLREAWRERASRCLLGNGKLCGAGHAGSRSPLAAWLCSSSATSERTPPRGLLTSQLLAKSGGKRSWGCAEDSVIVSRSGPCEREWIKPFQPAKLYWFCGRPIPETISASFPRRCAGQIGICAEARPSRRHASSGKRCHIDEVYSLTTTLAGVSCSLFYQVFIESFHWSFLEIQKLIPVALFFPFHQNSSGVRYLF